MFYAVILCGNPNHKRYMKPIMFMQEGEEEDVPLETETEEEMEETLKDNMAYEAGWVQIIEID